MIEAAPITGVHDQDRLRVVAEAELVGHLGDPALDAVVATLQLALDVPIAVVNIVTAGQQTYAAEVGVGAPCTSVPDGLSFCAEVVETGRALAVSDASAHPVYAQNPLVLSGVIGAYAGVPLIDNGVVLGTVSVFAGVARAFSADELTILRHQARLASSVLALRRSARTDVLTGLPNRAAFLDRLTRALARVERYGETACVMYLDLDGFKAINDTHGHAAGDEVLRELAQRLSRAVRPGDTLARVGGDEFALVCEDVKSEVEAARVAGRLVEALRPEWVVNGTALPVAVSIGFAVTDARGSSRTALLRDADAAMYRAKRTAGSRALAAVPRQGGPGPEVSVARPRP